MDHRERRNAHTVSLIDHLGLAEVELDHFEAEALLGVDSARGLAVPVARFPDRLDEMAGSVSLFRSARPPDLDRPRPPRLAVAAEQGDQIGGVVGVQVGEEDLVKGVDGQSEPREVRHRAAADVEQEEVSLGVADLDQDARRRLRSGDPGDAAPEHGYA